MNPELIKRTQDFLFATEEEIRRGGISDRQVYEDLRLLKLCLGNLQQMTRDWYQYLFTARCEEDFQMARDKGDAGAFAKVLSSLGKFTRLDHEQLTGPDYSQIIPQQFEITSDPSVAGFKRIPNVLQLTRQLERRFKKEIEVAEYEIMEPKTIKEDVPTTLYQEH